MNQERISMPQESPSSRSSRAAAAPTPSVARRGSYRGKAEVATIERSAAGREGRKEGKGRGSHFRLGNSHERFCRPGKKKGRGGGGGGKEEEETVAIDALIGTARCCTCNALHQEAAASSSSSSSSSSPSSLTSFAPPSTHRLILPTPSPLLLSNWRGWLE